MEVELLGQRVPMFKFLIDATQLPSKEAMPIHPPTSTI